MELQGRAYYNSMRMDWVDDPSLDLKPWQVEDYRSFALDTLFEKLEDLGFTVSREEFLEMASETDSPEELTKALLEGSSSSDVEGKVYLVVFELWRRLLPEKLSLSVFCDEMDALIFKFIRNEGGNAEALEDMIAHLQMFLDENCDDGIEPAEAFTTVQSFCANDIEGFLYDYIADQIDGGNEAYASELLEGFSPYLSGSKWFALLEARIAALSDPEETSAAMKKVMKHFKEPDLEFAFEVLSFQVGHGDEESFKLVVKKIVPLLEVEEDFKLVLSECADFYHRLDQESIEGAIGGIIASRQGRSLDQSLQENDPDFSVLIKLLS